MAGPTHEGRRIASRIRRRNATLSRLYADGDAPRRRRAGDPGRSGMAVAPLALGTNPDRRRRQPGPNRAGQSPRQGHRVGHGLAVSLSAGHAPLGKQPARPPCLGRRRASRRRSNRTRVSRGRTFRGRASPRGLLPRPRRTRRHAAGDRAEVDRADQTRLVRDRSSFIPTANPPRSGCGLAAPATGSSVVDVARPDWHRPRSANREGFPREGLEESLDKRPSHADTAAEETSP